MSTLKYPTNISQPSIPTWTLLSLSITFLGTIITFIASWWILAWTGLVLNLLAAAPIMAFPKKSAPSEAAMKYFILQSIAATSILMMILLSQNLPAPTIALILTMALTLKLGTPPFHFWIPQVIPTLPWPTILLISTWQKLAPLAFMVATLNLLSIWPLTLIAALSMLVGSLGTWTASNLKTLIAYSSINHTGWMILLLASSLQMVTLYFLFYTAQMLTLTAFILLLPPNQSTLIPTSSPYTNTLLLFLLAVVFVTMSGMPPFIGFIPKMMLFLSASSSLSAILMLSVMIASSLIITTTYLSIAMNSIPLKFLQTPIFTPPKLATLSITILIPMLLLPQIALLAT